MKKIMIIGGDSQIGHSLFDNLKQNHYEVYKTTRNEHQLAINVYYLDLMNISQFQCEIQFDVVILCAALTKIDACERDNNLSEIINYQAQIQLVEYFKKQNPIVHIVFLSSNAVFSGKKPLYQVTDTPDPITVYGKHKLNAEVHLKSIHQELTILRLTKVLTNNYSLFQSWLISLENRLQIYPYSNVFLAPLAINQVTDIILNIIKTKTYGSFHLSGKEDISYYDLAINIVKLKALNISLVQEKLINETIKNKTYSSLAINGCECIYKGHNFSITNVLNNIFK